MHVFVQREFYFFAAGWAARSDALRRVATPAVSLLPPLSRHLPRQEEASSNESWCLPLQSGRCASSQLPRQRRGSQGWGAHQGSGSGKRSREHSGLHQTCIRLPPCGRVSCRSTGPSSSAPQPSSSPTPCTALLFFSARRRRGGGCNTDKVTNLRPGCE